jgi:hypothetical protein
MNFISLSPEVEWSQSSEEGLQDNWVKTVWSFQQNIIYCITNLHILLATKRKRFYGLPNW